MDKEQIEALKAVAATATQEKWTAHDLGSKIGIRFKSGFQCFVNVYRPNEEVTKEAYASAAFIEAFDPITISELLASATASEGRIAELTAKNAALLKDRDEATGTFQWLLGMGDDFPVRREGQGLYWWRAELNCRLANPSAYAALAGSATPSTTELTQAFAIATAGPQLADEATSKARAEGRAEAVQIILGLSAEDGFDDCIGNHQTGFDGEWDVYWKDDKLRALFRVDDVAWSVVQEMESRLMEALCKESAEAMDKAFATPIPQDTLKNADSERMKSWAKFIVRQGNGLPDHACAECVPHSDILKAGFQCVYHQAIAAMATKAPAMSNATEGGDHG